MQQNADIRIIEGRGTPEKMHPMQAAFVAHDDYQCRYCTSEQIMSAAALRTIVNALTASELKECIGLLATVENDALICGSPIFTWRQMT